MADGSQPTEVHITHGETACQLTLSEDSALLLLYSCRGNRISCEKQMRWTFKISRSFKMRKGNSPGWKSMRKQNKEVQHRSEMDTVPQAVELALWGRQRARGISFLHGSYFEMRSFNRRCKLIFE